MIIATPRLAPTEARRRRASLLQQLVEVDPLACPVGHGALRIVAFITQASVIDQILAHLRTRTTHAAHAGARGPHRPWDLQGRVPRDAPAPLHRAP